MQLIAIFLCFVVSTVLAAEGKCPTVKYLEGFTQDAFLGEWFEIQRYDNELTTGGCVMAKYEIHHIVPQQPEPFRADYFQIFDKDNAGNTLLRLKPITGTEAKYNVFLNDEEAAQKLDHNILKTDYKVYAVIYDCKDDSGANSHTQRLSILSRKTDLDKTVLETITKELKELKIDVESLKDVEQNIDSCNSATSITLSTILSGIILLMLTRQF